MKPASGAWDQRPHRSRVVTVDMPTLVDWAQLFDSPGTHAAQARLVRVLSTEHLAVLQAIARQPNRLADVGYQWARGWEEKGAKEDGYIVWRTDHPASWSDVIL